MTELTKNQWDDFLSQHPNVHILQTSAWGDLKSAFGWDAARLVVDNVGAQILFRRLPMGFTLAYIPKGPVGNNWGDFWPEVDKLCRQRKTVFLKVEPDMWQGETDSLGAGSPPPGFRLSSHEIQPPAPWW